MAIFNLVIPAGKLSALTVLRAQGHQVRMQDDSPVVETDDPALAATLQAWIDAYSPLPRAQAVVIQRVKDEARRRILLIIGPDWQQSNAIASGVRLCWRAIRVLTTQGAPEPEPALTSAELTTAETLLNAWATVTAIRHASNLIELDVLALETEAEIWAFDPVYSPRWPAMIGAEAGSAEVSSPEAHLVRDRNLSAEGGSVAFAGDDAELEGPP